MGNDDSCSSSSENECLFDLVDPNDVDVDVDIEVDTQTKIQPQPQSPTHSARSKCSIDSTTLQNISSLCHLLGADAAHNDNNNVNVDDTEMASQHSSEAEADDLFGDTNEVAALDIAMATPHMRPINSNSPFSPRKDDSQSIASTPSGSGLPT